MSSFLLYVQYSDLQSPKRKSELGEMIVPCTGFEGHQFKLRFPFSWLILETVESLFRDLLFVGDGKLSLFFLLNQT